MRQPGRQISLLNSGDVNYNFSWNTGTRNDISVEPASGTVHKGEKVTVELCYSPSLLEHLDNYRVFCNVENGNRYSLSLSGQGHRPGAQRRVCGNTSLGRRRREVDGPTACSSRTRHEPH